MIKELILEPLSSETLANLFLSMAMKDDDEKEAKKAFEEFHMRYKDYLYTIVKKACSSWKQYGDDLIVSVFDNTFLTIYEKAEQFMEIEDAPFIQQEKKMKSWIGNVAKNEMFQLLRELRDDNMRYSDDLTFLDRAETENIIQQNRPDILLAEKALLSLKEKEQDILRTYLLYEDGRKKLPSEEIGRLAEQWNVLPDSLRQIKKRSIAKVEVYINTYKNK